MKDVVERVCHLTPGGRGQRPGKELQFSYRRSRTGGREIITLWVPPQPGTQPRCRQDGGADGPAQGGATL